MTKLLKLLAIAWLAQVAAADDRDAYAIYFTGQCLFDLSRYDESLAEFRRAMDVDLDAVGGAARCAAAGGAIGEPPSAPLGGTMAPGVGTFTLGAGTAACGGGMSGSGGKPAVDAPAETSTPGGELAGAVGRVSCTAKLAAGAVGGSLAGGCQGGGAESSSGGAVWLDESEPNLGASAGVA